MNGLNVRSLKYFVGAVLVIFTIVAVIKSEPQKAIEHDHVDPIMPRSYSVFSMEIGDIEYLEWERNNGR